MRKTNTPKKVIWTYEPNSQNPDSHLDSWTNAFSQPAYENNFSSSKNSKKNNYNPLLLWFAIWLIGLVFFALAFKNDSYKEKCTQWVSSTWEQIVDCTTYKNNQISSHTTFPYVFWLNSRWSNYTNNAWVYERVWNTRNSYSPSYSSSTTKKSTLGTSWKSSWTSS